MQWKITVILDLVLFCSGLERISDNKSCIIAHMIRSRVASFRLQRKSCDVNAAKCYLHPFVGSRARVMTFLPTYLVIQLQLAVCSKSHRFSPS